MNKRKKIGLALGSGGAKGLAHIGVIKTLLENNIPIDYIAGSSIGAWIAAHFGLYQDISKLEEYTVLKKKEKFYTLLEPAYKGGIIKGKKLEKLLSKWLENASFKDTKIPIKIVTTDLVSGESFVISKGSLVTAVHASMAIPTLFKPVEYKDRFLIDGGVSNPVPDDVVRGMGADIVISVNLDNYQKNEKFGLKDLKIKRTASRGLNIMRHYLAEYSIRNSDFIIEPYLPDLGIIRWKKYFTKEFGPKIINIGVKETKEFIDDIKKEMESD